MGLNLNMVLEDCRPMTLHIGSFGVDVRGYMSSFHTSQLSDDVVASLAGFEEYVVKDGQVEFFGFVQRPVRSMVSYGHMATIYVERAIEEYMDADGILDLEVNDQENWIEEM